MAARSEGLGRIAMAGVACGLVAAGLSGCASAPPPNPFPATFVAAPVVQTGASDADSIVTGSITPAAAPAKGPDGTVPAGIGAGDWAQARLALDMALADTRQDVSQPWDNPETGNRGTATPVGPARAGCRGFMISVVDGKGADRWVQGEACKARSGTVLSQVRLLGAA